MAPDVNENPAFDPTIQTEEIAFKPGELVNCEGCGRANPPNRLNCIYCGNALGAGAGAAAAIKPNFRKLELWERGFNVVVQDAAAADPSKLVVLLSSEMAVVGAILNAGVPLPLARVESERDATFLQSRLSDLRISTQIVADAELAAEKPPIRVSRVDLDDERISLTDFNTGKLTEFPKDDLVLIMAGSITHSRVDSLEKKRRRGKTKVIDETTTSSDESVLDLYSRDDSTGYRVHLTGFDFSCLGEQKGMLAADNLRRLRELLAASCPNAKLVDNYDSVREALGEVWEVESRKDSQGLVRSGLGKREFGSVASTSNLTQFTKYSRLQWHLV